MTVGNKGSAGRGKPFDFAGKNRSKPKEFAAKGNAAKTANGKSQDNLRFTQMK
jgi:hypothetical protein